MGTVICMPRLGEGTRCWRPVQAADLGDDLFEVTQHPPDGESWPLLPILGCDAAIMGSPPAAQAWSVDEQYEDFVYDLVSTSVDRDVYPRQNGAVCGSKFADLVFARLEK